MAPPTPTILRTLLLPLALAMAGGCASSKARRVAAPAAAAPAAGPTEIGAEAPKDPRLEPTVVSTPEIKVRDPLIRVNRVFFAFNDVLYRYFLIPVAKGYVWAVPERARRCVGNFFHNVKTPIYLANDILQAKPKAFGTHLGRFLVNSTVGLGGLFDPAKAKLGLEKTRTGFEDTLGRWGAGYGIYLVLPVFGSSDLRNGPALAADYFLNPIPYLLAQPERSAVMTYDSFQEFAPSGEKYETLRKKADDPYIFFRNLYLQGKERDVSLN